MFSLQSSVFQIISVSDISSVSNHLKFNTSIPTSIRLLRDVLFGIASDNGVLVATALDKEFEGREIRSIEQAQEATIAAAKKRIRPALMTSSTTILALLPILTSSGRGADIMIPMAIPSFGGMIISLVTLFVVPILYCANKEKKIQVFEKK